MLITITLPSQCVTWNPLFRKLTTSDESGLIIVWMLHRGWFSLSLTNSCALTLCRTVGMWYEEMINNRNKSVVRDMKWTADGRKIAIVYEDGAVIVGSVDGNRLWGKELNLPLRFVEWSPDGRLILFVTLEGEVWVYDADGLKVRSLALVGQDHSYSSLGGEIQVTGIHWYCSPQLSANSNYRHSGGADSSMPFTLCLAFDNGKVQLSRGDDDSSAEIVDTELSCVSYCKWSTRGNILAIVGIAQAIKAQPSSKGESKKDSAASAPGATNVVKFYDSYGKFMRYLRIPGENITAVSW